MKLVIGILANLVLLGTGVSCNAGSVTGTGFDKSATIENLKTNMPQGSKITETNCEKVGVPSGGDAKYRCTLIWE